MVQLVSIVNSNPNHHLQCYTELDARLMAIPEVVGRMLESALAKGKDEFHNAITLLRSRSSRIRTR